ncbi:hypothetical protein Bpfe_004325 [Biomphalaria pfeifferi]|uniref:TNFR-Cys domain-containing protein n=1 Tax=Biomphalaria pfeifferi TaxID=112525 RepID=A0AAD8C604_BIOPF|nr:hypothetical protein Bpfe_004325 [Biomphalaria pfeifferi]
MLSGLFKVLVLVYLMSTTKTKACDCDPDITFNAVSHVQFKDSSRAGRCEAGQRLDESGRCILCPKGTFLTTSMAKIGWNQECLICHEPNITREEVIQACTSTEDTKVKCSAGHYKPNWSSSCPCSGSQCTVCDQCGLGINLYRDYEVVQCSPFHNAKCCEEEDRDVNCEPRTTPSAAAFTALNTNSTPLVVIPSYRNPDRFHFQRSGPNPVFSHSLKRSCSYLIITFEIVCSVGFILLVNLK